MTARRFSLMKEAKSDNAHLLSRICKGQKAWFDIIMQLPYDTKWI